MQTRKLENILTAALEICAEEERTGKKVDDPLEALRTRTDQVERNRQRAEAATRRRDG